MVTEGIQGSGRKRVDGVRPDQVVRIESIRVGRILGAGAGPENALQAGALLRQLLPAVTGEGGLEALVGHLGIGDADGALQGLCSGALYRLQHPVHLDVHPADEEGGHRGDLGDVASVGVQRLQPGDVGLRHLIILIEREHQGNVDVDPLTDERLDGRHALGRGGHLDHHVGPIDGCEQPTRFRDGPLRVIRQVWAHLQADVAVGAVGGVVDGTEHVGGHLNVLDGQGLVYLLGGQLVAGRSGLLPKTAQLVVVVVAAGDSFLEDRGIGRHAAQPLVNQVLQPPPRLTVSIGDKRTSHVIKPDGLTKIS